MISRQEQIQVVDRAINEADKALRNEFVVPLLGDRTLHLGGLIERLVPVLTTDVQSKMSALDDPDSIPFVVAGDEKLSVDRGSRQFSRLQRINCIETISDWSPRTQTSEQAADILEVNAARMDLSTIIDNQLNGSGEADVKSGVITAETRILNNEFDFDNKPAAAMIWFWLRPAVCVRPGINAEVLLHELVHVGQKEKRPAAGFSSQEELDMWLLRNELEAYYVGAQVVLGNRGLTSINEAEDDNVQLAVERVRANESGNTVDDPFNPSTRLLRLYEKKGMGRQRMFSGAPDYNKVYKAARSLHDQSQEAKPKRKNGRYTPPKSRA